MAAHLCIPDCMERWNDDLMGSLDVVGEARSCFLAVGLNADALLRMCHRRPLAAMHAFEIARPFDRWLIRGLARGPLQLQSVVSGALRIEAS